MRVARVPGRNCRGKRRVIYGLRCDFHFLRRHRRRTTKTFPTLSLCRRPPPRWPVPGSAARRFHSATIPRHPSVFSGFSFFFFFPFYYLKTDERTDGRTEKQQEKINKQRLPGTGCTHNIVVILACRRSDVFRRTYFRNLAGSGVARLVRARFYFLFAETVYD